MPSETRPRYALIVARTQRPLAVRVTVARTWRGRLVGLLGRRQLPMDEALVLPNCRSIHTVGMRFAIDAVFVDRDWRVVALRSPLEPGRVVWPVWRAWGVVEVPCGTLARMGVRVGDELTLVEKNGHPT